MLGGLILFILLLNTVSAGYGQEINNPFEDWQMVWISYQNSNQLLYLMTQLDVWEVDSNQLQVLAYLSPQQLTKLETSGLVFRIDEDRLENLKTPFIPDALDQKGIPNFSCYRTVQETSQTLQSLAATYPGLSKWSDYGDSWMKSVSPTDGYDLEMLQITNRSLTHQKPVFFLVGAIHARELTAGETATRFAEYLLTNYGTDPDITWMVDQFDIRIVAIANPDGRIKAEQGLLWRKNVHTLGNCAITQFGVDLNRNHSFHWNVWNIYNDPCAEIYAGPSAGSEPETQALETLLTSLFPDQRGSLITDAAPADTAGVFITLHSYGEVVLWPWGDSYDPPPNAAQLQTLGRKLAYFNHYDASQARDFYPSAGASDDFVYGELGTAAYTLEMGTDFFQDCTSYESTIWPDNRDALLAALRTTYRPYQQPSGPDTFSLSVSESTVQAGQEITLSAQADDTRFVGDEPVQAIQNARLSVDQPSWMADRFYPVFAADGSFSKSTEALTAEFDTGSLTPGNHLLFVETQDQDDQWGSPAAVAVTITQPTQAVHIDALTPDQGGDDGQTVLQSFTVKNIGLTSTAYSIRVEGNKWVNTLSHSQTPVLNPGESATVMLSVEIPLNSPPGKDDLSTVIVEDINNTTISDQQTLRTFVFGYAVSLDPATDTLAAAAGESISYTLTVTNLGDTEDLFDISFTTQHDWDTTLSADSTDLLAPGDRFSFQVNVQIPQESVTPASDVCDITVTSQHDPTIYDSSRLNSRVYVYLTNIEPEDSEVEGLPGEWINYTLNILNQGEGEDQFLLDADGPDDWEWLLPESTGIIPAGEMEAVLFQVHIPETGIVGEQVEFTITAQSMENPAVIDSMQVFTTIVDTRFVFLPLLTR